MNTSPPRPGGRLRGLLVLGLACCTAGIVWFAVVRQPTPRKSLQSARQALRDGRNVEAEQLAQGCLEDPDVEVDAVLLAARSALQQDAPQRALGYLQRVQQEASPRTLAAHLLRARLLRDRMLQMRESEHAFRTVLEIAPAHLEANEELARLLATCGRRREAIPHILRVLQVDDNDLLVLLARDSGLIHEPALLQRCRQAAPDDPLPPFGLAQYAAARGKTTEAISLLREALAVDPQFLPAWAQLGVQLVETHDPAGLAQWAGSLPPGADAYAATWGSLGRFAEQTGQHAAAIRCYWESLRRAPESRESTFRLSQLLARSGQDDSARRLEDRLTTLDDLSQAQDRALFSSHPAGLEELLQLIRSCRRAGRIWEAFAWTRVALEVDAHSAGARRLWAELVPQISGLPLQLTVPQANPAAALDFSTAPRPIVSTGAAAAMTVPDEVTTAARFRSDGAQIGFDFTFRNGATDPPSLRMYEFTGGGIGVIDADLDGYPDVFCTQGGDSPDPDSADEAGDQFFRNLAGRRFENVTAPARLVDRRFGQGTAVADFDADGFADIYVANIGANRLWHNNGDGTFIPRALPAGDERAWTTSCLMADLNGDSLPDLYDVNYLTGEDVFERTCRNPDGSTAMCMPFDFDGATDRLLLNDGAGAFVDATGTAFSAVPDGKGLGIIAWQEDDDGRAAVLVANDTTPNAFLTSRPDDRQFVLHNSSIAAGLGLNSDGKAEGCMGIALGDVNDDGRLDVHITNFLAESNTLYLADSQPGFFTDRTREIGLHDPTWNVLGFGTQFLDADLDGRLELFVTNGHLQDLRRFDRPYRMPPQLFSIRSGRAKLVPAARLGTYFEQQWLGRSSARIDWNRDGREDLLVGHLDDPTVLLTNACFESGKALSLRLVGTASPRDGTGATVRMRVGDRWQIRQITAGDGYQASNQKQVVFGLGPAEVIEEIVVKWPVGTLQRFHSLRSGQQMILVEAGERLMRAP